MIPLRRAWPAKIMTSPGEMIEKLCHFGHLFFLASHVLSVPDKNVEWLEIFKAV